MGKVKTDISILQNHAISKDGLLLSTKYINVTHKLTWQCSKNHIWEASWHSIHYANSWCPECSGNNKPCITILQKYAEEHGGKLLSNIYINSSNLLEWECKEKHIWKARWNNINKKNSWCPVCAGFKKQTSIDKIREHANKKYGILLSKTYINNHSLLEWKCKENHIWKATWASIRDNHWCPICDNESQKLNINDIQKYANKLKGALLSTKYINSHSHLEWKCEEGHIWKTCWETVYKGSWCPECNTWKTEKLVKQLLECRLNISLKKKRFYYNKNSARKFYEFDGYNEEHKIAFEYNGYQHYVFPNRFHKTEEIFKAAQQRDKDKIQYCKDNNIILLVIPYAEEKNLEQYINKLLYNNGLLNNELSL